MQPKLRFFDLARIMSRKSSHPSHPLGSVLVQKNRIINVGFNKLKTHTRATNKFNTIHAEFSVIFGLDYKVTKGSILYVWRSKYDESPGISRPCNYCQELIKAAGIKGVFYSVDYEPFYEWEKYG